VAILSVSPLFLALLLGVAWPELLHAAMGTTLGGLSWMVATLLGFAAGALYANGLGRLEHVPGLVASPARRSAATVLAAVPAVGLCVVPALFLLVAGPACATTLQQDESPTGPAVTSVRAAAYDVLGQVLRHLPRALPLAPGAN
jgi:hypothetical protein